MKKRALLIDVDNTHAEVVREYLDSWAVDAVAATDLNQLSDLTVSLVIANARETKEETLSLCGQIRDQSHCSEAPLLVALDRWGANQVHYVLDLAAARAVIKPFDERDLANVIKPFDERDLANVMSGLLTESAKTQAHD